MRILWLSLGVFFVFGYVRLSGQSDYYRSTIFKRITVNTGLAHRTAHDLVQDQQGYIWIATNNGLNRFDGRNMLTFRWDIQDENSLPDNRVNQLMMGKEGRLWIISGPGKLSWYSGTGNKFNNLSLLHPDKGQQLSTYSIAKDSKADVYLLASDQRIYRLDLQPDKPAAPQLIPLRFTDSGNPSISRFLIDQQDRMWVSTHSGELICYQMEGQSLSIKKKFSDFGRLALLNRDGARLWLARGHQIYRIDLEGDDLELDPVCKLKDLVPDINSNIRQILADNQGRIWIGTFGNGVIQLELRGSQYTYRHFPGNSKSEDAISNNHITRMFIDKYQVLWIGTQVGVFWTPLNQKPFFQISKTREEKNTITNNIIQAVYRNQFLWIGTRNGLSVIDTTSNQVHNYTTFPLFPAGRDYGGITCLFRDSNNRMWMGTGLGNLYQVRNPDQPDQLRFRPIDRSNANVSFININNIQEDELGRLWVGTTYEGIFILNDITADNRYQFTALASLPEIVISNMYKDPFENTMWVGTSTHGLLRIRIDKQGSYQSYFFQSKPNSSNSLSLNHTNPIVKTDPQTLWVGTIGGGLNKLTFHAADSVQYEWYTTQDGLKDNTIHTLQADRQGNLWLGGTGLSKLNPNTGTITHFGKEDGLQSNLFIVNSTFQDSLGRLYFGGPYGLNFFHPEKIRPETKYPDIVLSGLKVLNTPIEVGTRINGRAILSRPLNQLEHLTIKEKENDLTLDIQALHHAAPSKTHLQYRLQGQQNSWIDVPDMQTSINYSNLQSGNYTFQVRASNGDGVWTPDAKELKITVLPYWYKTSWAYFAYGLLSIVLLLLFRYIVLVQSNLRNNLKIAQVKLEKDQEVAEMKTRFFNNITHELRTPLTLIKGPIEELVAGNGVSGSDQKNYHHIIHHNANRLLNLVNRLLDFRKAETGHFRLEATEEDLVSFSREIYLSFQQLAKEKQIHYSFEAPDEAVFLYFDRDKMEIVLCNLLSNAFKYSEQGDTVCLKIQVSKGQCTVEVSDSGKGIPPEELDHIFNRFYQIARAESSEIIGTGIGLAMVKNIVELHQGEIRVESRPGTGSTFFVTLPLGEDHLSSDQIIREIVREDEWHIDPPRIIAEPDTATTSGRNGRQQLLIVEDNPEIRRFIRSIFQREFQIEESADGEAALALLKNYRPDLIISDIMMEPMDGITFCTNLKENPDLFHIPLILLTARTSNVFRVDGLSSGADAYITKPFNAEVLRAQAHSLLKSRASLRRYYTDNITLGPKKIEIPSEELLFLEELISVIEEKIGSEELTAENLAAAMAMSHSTLYRKIKSYTGESINSFIRSIRLKRAAQLLTDSDLNVTQVAFQVGFSDVNYFGKCFKQQFKMSPSVYAKTKI